jgi:hypothetical protein
VGGKRELQIPRLPPDFLSDLVVSVNIMRLSSKKAAHGVVSESSVVGNPEFAPNDKGEGSAHLSNCDKGWTYLYAEREANDPSIHITTVEDHGGVAYLVTCPFADRPLG